MNISVFCFLALASLAAGHVPIARPSRSCENISPEIYCASLEPTETCDQYQNTKFCKHYMSLPVCIRGPEAYCTIPGADRKCKRVNQCMTWPDDSVVAYKRPNQIPSQRGR